MLHNSFPIEVMCVFKADSSMTRMQQATGIQEMMIILKSVSAYVSV